jgi:rhodanese-related sulfurtransferase
MFWKKAADATPLITPEELATALAGDARPVLVDVRGPRDFAEGHLPGAVDIPLDELDARAGEFDPAAFLVFY